MYVDRVHVKKAFAEYTAAYNADDPKIKLKIDHTYRVAALCERIAKAAGMCAYDVELAWLSGMLHDVGRFEQIKRYNTFSERTLLTMQNSVQTCCLKTVLSVFFLKVWSNVQAISREL